MTLIAGAGMLGTLIAVALTAVAPAGQAPDAAAVLVEDYRFTPAAVSISAGGTVMWTVGDDPEQHTVTPRGAGPFEDSGQLFAGDTFRATFVEPGTFSYVCTLHPTMVGTVVVEAVPGGTTTPGATPGATRASPASEVPASPGPEGSSSPGPEGSSRAGSASGRSVPLPAVPIAALAATVLIAAALVTRRNRPS